MNPLVPCLVLAALTALGAGYLVLRAETQALGAAPLRPPALLRWTLLGLQALLSTWLLCLVPILALFQDQRGETELGRNLELLARGSAAGLLAFLPGAAAVLVMAVKPLYGPLEDRRVVGPLLAAALYGAALLALALQRATFLG